MIGGFLSNSDGRTVVKSDAHAEVKEEWESEFGEEDLLLIRYLHQLIQDNL